MNAQQTQRLSGLVGALLMALAGLVLLFSSQNGPTEVVLRWETASEVQTAGYNLYRATSEDGPFEQINERLIPASPARYTGGKYVYTDTGLIPGRTYYYQLEEVETSGQRTPVEVIPVTVEQSLWARLQPILGGFLIVLSIGIAVSTFRERQSETELHA
nr:hypothetical protein [Ardenticatena sp.]